MEYLSPQEITDTFIDRFDQWFEETTIRNLPPPWHFLVEPEPEPEPVIIKKKVGRPKKVASPNEKKKVGRPKIVMTEEERKERKKENQKRWYQKQKKIKEKKSYYEKNKEKIKARYEQRKQEKDDEIERLKVLNAKFLEEQQKLLKLVNDK